MASERFYHDLTPFSDFSAVQDLQSFQHAPADWVVVVADIKGSTQAAQSGRGREINLLGAAAISIVANSTKNLTIPAVFGGDGANLILPEKTFIELRKQFVGLIRLAREKFNLELRVGVVPVRDLVQSGYSVLVGKYQTSPNSVFAQFVGSGISQAETWVKGKDPRAVLLSEIEEHVFPNLDGLSCRLMPFASQNGVVLSLIAKPKMENDSYWLRNNLIPAIKQVLNNNFFSASPILKKALTWKLIQSTLDIEVAITPPDMVSKVKLVLSSMMANIMLKFNISGGAFRPEKYKSELPKRCDFTKLDNTLRMIFDCSLEQSESIESLLRLGEEKGEITYGLHRGQNAVLTCITQVASAGEHIHFVDGENCGYTQAALKLKQKL